MQRYSTLICGFFRVLTKLTVISQCSGMNWRRRRRHKCAVIINYSRHLGLTTLFTHLSLGELSVPKTSQDSEKNKKWRELCNQVSSEVPPYAKLTLTLFSTGNDVITCLWLITAVHWHMKSRSLTFWKMCTQTHRVLEDIPLWCHKVLCYLTDTSARLGVHSKGL